MKNKKSAALLLAMAMVFSFAGCKKDSLPPILNQAQALFSEKDEPEKEKPSLSLSSPIEDFSTLEQLNHDYIEPLSYCIPFDWKSPTDIHPDDFILFYLVKANPETKACLEEETAIYPQEQVESFIQNYFDVDTAFLRTAKMYDPKLKAYHPWVVCNAWESRVITASASDDFLSVDYELFAEIHNGKENVMHGCGNVLMKKDPNNNGEYRFIKHRYRHFPISKPLLIN